MRRFTRSARETFGRWCSTHVWFTDVHESASPTELASSFTRELNSATNVLFPTKVINIHNSDKPWMSPSLKQLILERQRAFYSGDRELWRHYKNKVCEEISCWKRMPIMQIKFNISKPATPRSGGTALNRFRARRKHLLPLLTLRRTACL